MELPLHYFPVWALGQKLFSLAPVVALYALLYSFVLVVYRLAFSKLSGFPGPKVAAATYWYEFYFDWLRKGKYIFEIEKMHEIYGPIVRINPDELSISDPEAYNDIYVSESRRRTDNYHSFIKGIDFDEALIMNRIVGLIPEPIVLWAFPSGRIFDKFKKVFYPAAASP
ncbi:MAG: hypothetical protein Q9177_000849 [Variospora cf. flavescens]